MRQAHKSMRKQRGAALVEMVMILPVLTILFLGIVQFGLVLREHQIVQNAAREGARLSSMPKYNISAFDSTTTPTDAQVRAKIQNLVVQYMNQENITITTANV